jgi:Ca2+-binding RTX toxin-like protein
MFHAGDGNDYVRSLSGNDTIDLGDGNDTVLGGSGNDLIRAGDGDNRYLGGSGSDDVTFGNGNNTVVFGRGVTSTAHLGDGRNYVVCGQGTDTVFLGSGNDTVYGGAGHAVIHAGSGHDILVAGTGADTFVFEDGGGAALVKHFKEGVDTLLIARHVNGLDLSSAADLVSHVSSDGDGNAVIDLGHGETITLAQVSSDEVQHHIGSFVGIA